MSFLPPVVMELRANAAQFISEQGKAASAAKSAAAETAAAAQKAATASRTASAAAVAATDKRIAAEAAAAEASKRLAATQSQSLGVMTQKQQAAYDKQVTASQRATNAVEMAAAREAQAIQKSAAAGDAFTAAQAKADAAANRTNSSLGRLAASAENNSEAWSRMGATTLGFGTAALLGVGMAIKSYADFDKQMSSVQAATMATGSEMSSLRDLAVAAGADTSFSAKEAAQGIEELSKAGIENKDILSGGLAGALSLAAAGSLGVAESAEFAASAMVQFGLKGKDIPHIADLLAAGAGKAQGSVQDMGLALSYAGVPAAAMGVSIEETTGAIALFAKSGIIGEKAGTALRAMFVSMANPTEKTQTLMDELGVTFKDAEGKFIGLDGAAQVLKDKLGGLSEMERNAALAQMFGNESLGAAVSLYKAGADGLNEMTDAVNESGYAAETARLKQNNLAGDIEKLGGSLDSVFLKSGSGANDVLRGLVQSTEGLIDAIGDIDPKVLQLGLGFAGIAGGAALVVGGFLTLFPKVMDAKKAFDDLRETNEKGATTLGKIGKAAGIAAAGMAALQIASVIFTDKEVTSAEAYGQAILGVAKASDAASAGKGLDDLFKKWDTFAGEGPDIRDLAGAVKEVVNPKIPAGIQDTLDGLFSWTGSAKNDLGQVRDRLAGMGEAMGGLAKNGGAETAAKSFQTLTKEFEKNGKGAKEALDSVPGYRDALQGLATQAGVTLKPQELLDFALGKIPASMQAAAGATEVYMTTAGQAAPVSEELTKALGDMGITTQGTVGDLVKFTDVLLNAGLINLSARDAARNYQAAIDAVGESVKENGTTLDINTDKGRNNQAALDAIASSGLRVVEANAKNGDSQESLQGNLDDTYNKLKDGAAQFGITGDEADALAQSILKVPPGVDVKTWMDSEAKRMAENTKSAIEGIPSRKDIEINITERTRKITQFEEIMGPTGKSASLFEAQNGYTGGAVASIMGMYNGGVIPGRPPSRPNVDNILSLVNGKPLMVRSGEFLTNEGQTKRNLPWLKAINAGMNMDDILQPATSGSAGPSYMSAPSSQSSSKSITNNLYVQTNASASLISEELAWAMRTQ